jgi:hypothetical protein
MLHCLLPLLRPGTLITSSIANAAKWGALRGPEYCNLMSWRYRKVVGKREKKKWKTPIGSRPLIPATASPKNASYFIPTFRVSLPYFSTLSSPSFCPFAFHLCWLVGTCSRTCKPPPPPHGSEMDGASEVMLRYSQVHARAAWRRFLMHQLTRPKYHG